MKKLSVALAGIALAILVSGAAIAQGRGGSMGGGGSHGGGSWSGGGGWHGGVWRGGGWGGGWRGGGWYGGGWGGCWGCWAPAFSVSFGAPAFWWGGWPVWSPVAVPVFTSSGSAFVDPDVNVYSQAAPASPAAVPANQYWYYCTDPAGYFPYVQNCSKAWMQVVPQADPGAPRLAPPRQQ